MRVHLFLSFVAGTLIAVQPLRAQIPLSPKVAQAELLPLAIGNEWEYSYRYSYDTGGPNGTGSHTDTGSALVRVIGMNETIDSTLWLLTERRTIWIKYDNGAFNGPIELLDTLTLIEENVGKHRLFRRGDWPTIVQSVLPFLPAVDTAVYRYDSVRTDGIRSFQSRSTVGVGFAWFTFMQDVGLQSTYIYDGCTCIGGFQGRYDLRRQTLVSVQDLPEHMPPQTFQLFQNYPNPFNPATTITFFLPEQSFVALKLFDGLGRETEALIDGELSSGTHTRIWRADGFASGIYMCVLRVGSSLQTKQLVLIK